MPDVAPTSAMPTNGSAVRLALAVSGGGHRATLFTLGALQYLADAGLSGSVTSIASVSGGRVHYSASRSGGGPEPRRGHYPHGTGNHDVCAAPVARLCSDDVQRPCALGLAFARPA
jgi:NTE family protein